MNALKFLEGMTLNEEDMLMVRGGNFAAMSSGNNCGNGCDGGGGNFCGDNCRPANQATQTGAVKTSSQG